MTDRDTYAGGITQGPRQVPDVGSVEMVNDSYACMLSAVVSVCSRLGTDGSRRLGGRVGLRGCGLKSLGVVGAVGGGDAEGIHRGGSRELVPKRALSLD